MRTLNENELQEISGGTFEQMLEKYNIPSPNDNFSGFMKGMNDNSLNWFYAAVSYAPDAYKSWCNEMNIDADLSIKSNASLFS
ncbi:bacteriocin [Serratia sp. NA_112.1]|uniref:bacteriocin n=1 Tax=unclassified Serratia (in: enterobacteria) TaxID=2647522 RepID=UPI004046932A